jgi:chemotaxis protein histidine kinase CheA
VSQNRNKKAPPATVERGVDHVVIRPRNLLKAKAAVMLDGPATFDEAAVRRAEMALKALSANFNGWMEEASRNLGAARDAIREKGAGEGRAAALHRAAHDIRGQAATLGFPLAARVGGNLCRLMDALPPAQLHGGALTTLVDQHVDAVRAIVREGVSKAKERTGEALASELEAIADRLLMSPQAPLH